MALIKCPECGKEISDTVKNCPNCGYKMKKKSEKKSKKNLMIILFVILVVLIVGGVVAFKSVKERKKQLYYENIVYNCMDKYRDELERPDSLVFKDITFYQGVKDIPFDMVGMEERFSDYKERSEKYPICLMRAIHETNTGVAIEVYAQFFYDKEIGDYRYSGEYLADTFNDEQYLDTIEKTVSKVYYESSAMLNKYFNTVGDIDMDRVKKTIKNND